VVEGQAGGGDRMGKRDSELLEPVRCSLMGQIPAETQPARGRLDLRLPDAAGADEDLVGGRSDRVADRPQSYT
jgi:hypothetical protein